MAVTSRQDGVKEGQVGVNDASGRPNPSHAGVVIENLIAALLGLGLLGYLVYALVRPEKF